MGASSPEPDDKNEDKQNSNNNPRKSLKNNKNNPSNSIQNSGSNQRKSIQNSGSNQRNSIQNSGSNQRNSSQNNDNNDNNQSSENENSDLALITKQIQNLKPINPGEVEILKPQTKEERNAEKLLNVIKNDDYDENNPEYHEYMFFPMKDGQKPQNIEPLLKKTKKKKKMYTFKKEKDTKKENELAKILHINYDIKKPKFPYSIQKLKSDKPSFNDYLVIEYNMTKMPKEKQEGYKKYEMISRTVHTNYKNVELDNYEYTKQNGERYDYLEMNNDTNQIRRLKLMKEKGMEVIWGENEEKDEENDEEKRINEKEENEDRFNSKQTKGNYTIRKMI